MELCLCHFPIVSWNGKEHGSWHIYGHIHTNPQDAACKIMMQFDHALNAGCMINHYKPASLEELIEHNKEYQTSVNRLHLTSDVII